MGVDRMNNTYLLNHFSKLRLLRILTLLSLLFSMTIMSIDTFAETGEPLDDCVGVDHPPFEEDYPGDGYSYLKLGLTMPLEYYDEGAEFTGELTGEGSSVSATELLSGEGQLFFTFPLYFYGIYDLMVYDDGGTMVYQNEVTVDASEPECDQEGLAVSPPKTVVEEPAKETPEEKSLDEPVNEPSEEPTAEPTATAPEDITDDGFVWWPLVLIGGGLIGILVGVMMLLKKNCEKERQAWLAALDQLKSASDKSRDAEKEAEKESGEREQLEEELADIRKGYPSAGREGGDEAWIEMDGRRITSRDVAMRREAERAAWDEYRRDPNSESAQDLVDDWEEIGTPESEEERRELDEEAKKLEEAIKEAKKNEKEARKKAEEAGKAEEAARKNEEAARLAYEACMKAALAPPKPKPVPKPVPKPETPGITEGPPTGGPTVTEEEEKPPCCKESDPPQERNRRNLGRVSIPVKLEVILEGGGAHEAAVVANDISEQLADASEKLGWISKAMDLKGIGEALVRDGIGWSLAGAAAPPAAGQALNMPTPTSPGQLAVDTLSILGKISSVIIGKVPELQERRLPDCDVQGIIKYNVFKAECVEIWVCRNGQWVKDRTRFTLTHINKSSGRMTKRRALTWAQAQRLIRHYEIIYRGRLTRALDRLAELEAGCK